MRPALRLPTLAGLAAAVALTAMATAQTPVDPTRVDRDPEARSGWLQLEVAVLVDDSAAALNAERWPLSPEPAYPGRWRWLLDAEHLEQLAQDYPEAAITQDPLGAITVTLPLRPDPDAELPDAAEPALPDPEDASLAAADDTGLIPLEAVLGDSTAPPADTLSGSEDPVPEADSEALAPPPLPDAFRRVPPRLLVEGLRSLRRATADRLVLLDAWVQPPGARNLPVLFDRSGDTDTWPALQGFVELRRANDIRLGVNFWLNTDGRYLPAALAPTAPPRAPAQITVVDPNPTPVSGEATTPDDSPADGLESGASPGAWPYQHVIQLADTRAIPRGHVRYFDHPVIKVLAAWRELTWAEVEALGAAHDALRPSPPVTGPAAQVPPGSQPIR